MKLYIGASLSGRGTSWNGTRVGAAFGLVFGIPMSRIRLAILENSEAAGNDRTSHPLAKHERAHRGIQEIIQL
jgi:hypothetical protein